MLNYFVVSDIHGCLHNFNEVLENFNPSTEQLVLLGDYIDRGPNSLGVLKRIIEVKELYPTTVVLMGNHEDSFLKFVNNKMDLLETLQYLDDWGGKETVENFTDDLLNTSDVSDKLEDNLKNIRSEITLNNKEIVDFLMNDLNYFYETENILFTHAGYDTTAASWTNTTNEKFIWIRNHYISRPKTHHVNVFGHTPSYGIRQARGEGYSNDPLLIEFIKGAYLAIDGACAFGGQLNAVVLNEEGKLLKKFISR